MLLPSPSPHSSLKKIFEKWRVGDTSKLTGKRLVEFEQDRKESNRRYDEAFNIVLSHTPDIELREFWQLFPEVEGGHRPRRAESCVHVAHARATRCAERGDAEIALVKLREAAERRTNHNAQAQQEARGDVCA